MKDWALQVYHRLPGPARSMAASLRGLSLRRWRYGPETERLVAEALEREHWSAERWKDWQEEWLAYVLHRAATQVPYYREYWLRPLALLEYGLAGLPVVATRVGQCPEVLDEGRAGILVPPAAPDELATMLLSLLLSPERRVSLGEQFRRRVQEVYSPGPIIQRISRVYDAVLDSSLGVG